jgi:hypothetical protein
LILGSLEKHGEDVLGTSLQEHPKDQRRKYTNNHYKPKVLNFKKKGERERESQTRLKPSSQTLQNLNKAKDKPWG